jgi:predicted ATPase/Tfp pilus assembly protein PilF
MIKPSRIIRTPDYRLRVFVSSTLRELASEREAAQVAIRGLRLAPVMFELGARPHPASELYRAYLDQSHIFLGIYWQSYGWVAPGMSVSGLEDEYLLAKDKPKLIYIKSPAPDREQKLKALLDRIKSDVAVSYKYFSNTGELRESIENDLAVMLTERFELSELQPDPAIAVVEAPTHNLPAQVTSFVGREEEIEFILTIFRKDDVRLLTLTGPGGTGKTRLALQVARQLIFKYKDGVWFVELAEASEPELVVSKIAQTLGVREGGNLSLIESLKQYLRNQQILLLLDNFEQVLAAAPIIAELLGVAQGLSVLVTSRALLNLRGEVEFPVPPLKLPDGLPDQDLERLIQCESVQMFLDRATAANPHFEINNSNATNINEICQRLDGLPLAIELAAAKIKILSPETMMSMLSSRLELLTGGARDLPERQKTLRNTLEWSVNLLEDKVKILFAQLGVFVGGFTIEAVEAVCNLKVETDKNQDFFEALSMLLNNSLIYMESQHSLGPRFKMLETIREFALELLAEIGEKDALVERHGQYFANRIVAVSSKYGSREADYWLDWLQSEHDNLRAALAWCLSNPNNHSLASWLVSLMIWFWYRRGFLIEGRDWCNQLLESPIVKENLEARGLALFSSGAMAMWQGDLKNALSFLEDAMKVAEQVGDPFSTANVLLFKGTALVNCGEDEFAIHPLEESLSLFKQLNMQYYQAIAMVHLGNAMLGLGDPSKARSYLEEAHSMSLEVGDNWLISLVLNNFGEVARVQGDYQLAKESYIESESLLREMGDKGDLARLVHNLGIIDLHVGNMQKAETQFVESLMMFRKLNNQRGMSECLAALASLWTDRGQLKRATKLLSVAESHLTATGATWWPSDRVEFEMNLKVLRSNLGEEEFEKVWNSGQMMKLDEAFALIMEANNME